MLFLEFSGLGQEHPSQPGRSEPQPIFFPALHRSSLHLFPGLCTSLPFTVAVAAPCHAGDEHLAHLHVGGAATLGRPRNQGRGSSGRKQNANAAEARCKPMQMGSLVQAAGLGAHGRMGGTGWEDSQVQDGDGGILLGKAALGSWCREPPGRTGRAAGSRSPTPAGASFPQRRDRLPGPLLPHGRAIPAPRAAPRLSSLFPAGSLPSNHGVFAAPNQLCKHAEGGFIFLESKITKQHIRGKAFNSVGSFLLLGIKVTMI